MAIPRCWYLWIKSGQYSKSVPNNKTINSPRYLISVNSRYLIDVMPIVPRIQIFRLKTEIPKQKRANFLGQLHWPFEQDEKKDLVRVLAWDGKLVAMSSMTERRSPGVLFMIISAACPIWKKTSVKLKNYTDNKDSCIKKNTTPGDWGPAAATLSWEPCHYSCLQHEEHSQYPYITWCQT
jgi:hypothetical protein